MWIKCICTGGRIKMRDSEPILIARRTEKKERKERKNTDGLTVAQGLRCNTLEHRPNIVLRSSKLFKLPGTTATPKTECGKLVGKLDSGNLNRRSVSAPTQNGNVRNWLENLTSDYILVRAKPKGSAIT
jgi:hypothetical protein